MCECCLMSCEQLFSYTKIHFDGNCHPSISNHFNFPGNSFLFENCGCDLICCRTMRRYKSKCFKWVIDEYKKFSVSCPTGSEWRVITAWLAMHDRLEMAHLVLSNNNSKPLLKHGYSKQIGGKKHVILCERKYSCMKTLSFSFIYIYIYILV